MADTPGWIIRRLNSLPTAEVVAQADDGSIALRFGSGPVRRVEPVSLAGVSAKQLLAFARGTAHLGGGSPRLLLIKRARPGVRKELAEAGLSWAERDSGFLHLDISPYFIRDNAGADAYGEGVAAQTERRNYVRPTKLVGRSGRCAESLILWTQAYHGRSIPEVTPAMLAEMADVSVQLATKVLHRLEKDDAIEGHRSGRLTRSWTVTRPDRILDLWAAEDVREPRVTKAYVWARSSRHLLSTLDQISEIAPGWAVGGVAAANLYVPTLTADPIPSIWIPDKVPVESVLKRLGGEIVGEEGPNIEFRQIPSDPWMLHRLVPARLDSTSHSPSADGTWRAALAPAKVHPPALEQLPSLSLVSRVRAYVETLHDGRGRAAEVAEVLRSTLALEPTHQ